MNFEEFLISINKLPYYDKDGNSLEVDGVEIWVPKSYGIECALRARGMITDHIEVPKKRKFDFGQD
jgi:hypothetical protein